MNGGFKMKYAYPAVFTPEDKGFSIFFPDVKMGATQGDTIADGLEMAQDFLVEAMIMLENEGQEIPRASKISELNLKDGEFASFVSVDTLEHRRKFDSKAVKKTLTIPAWLNTIAEKNSINFSSVLQEALKEKLQLVD